MPKQEENELLVKAPGLAQFRDSVTAARERKIVRWMLREAAALSDHDLSAIDALFRIDSAAQDLEL